MRAVVRALAIIAGLAAVAGAAVVFGGLYNVSARAGHFPGVPWVLHTTFERSVRLRAPAQSEVPDLTEAMAALGARHFDAACNVCHDAPGALSADTVDAMLPEPPPITAAVDGWEARHLHWIVYEGVKMSGMPHWPSVREDDVWAVVAFLTRVDAMEAEEYAALTAWPEVEGPPGLAYCASCHGADGRSGNPRIPRLDILGETYLGMSLDAFADDMRESGIMQHAATAVPRALLPALAEHYAAQPPEGRGHPAAADLIERGRQLAFAESDDGDIPACRACHGPWPDKVRDGFPSLAGQYAPYLAEQLRLWHEDLRGGGELAELMYEAAEFLEPGDIDALAAYYASLPPARLDAARDPLVAPP